MLALLLLLLAPLQSDVAATAQKAQEYMAAGRYREAIPLCLELVKAVPHNARLLMNLGVAQQMTGDYAAAIENLSAAVKLDGSLLAANLYLGMAEMSVGHPDLALAPFRKTVALKPDVPELREALGDALFQANYLEEAVDQLRQVTTVRPMNAAAWYTLGQTYLALARKGNTQLVAHLPDDSVYRVALNADDLLRRQQYRRAFALFSKILQQDGSLVSARIAIAKIYETAGHADWAQREQDSAQNLDCTTPAFACEFAARHYDSIITATKDDKSAAALYWRAQAFTGLSDEAFAKLDSLPPSKELYLHRAGMEYDGGHQTEVVAELRKALALAPNDLAVLHQLAMALGAARQFDAAFQMAQQLLTQDPNSAELNALAGDALLNQQRAADSIPFFLKSLAAEPNNLITHRSLGLAYMQTAAPKSALPHLQAAAAADVDGSVNFQLATAYRQTAQPELAKAAMSRYRELSAKSAVSPEPEITAPQ